MNKIIAAFDGLKFSDSCATYALEFARQSHAHLLGVFLEDFTYHSYKVQELVGEEGVSTHRLHLLQDEDVALREKSIRYFEDLCRTGGVNYSLHRDRNIAIRELLHESIFGDLLVIDRKETLTHYEESIPTRFIKDLLANVQCPVLVTPEKYKSIEKILFLYDGEPSSVYAIKMFSYILSCGDSIPIEVLSVRSQKDSSHLPDNRLLKELMKRHGLSAEYIVLKGKPEEEIIAYVKHLKEHALIVLGAYQRGMVSRWYRQSMADLLMKEINCPLFIAHYKV